MRVIVTLLILLAILTDGWMRVAYGERWNHSNDPAGRDSTFIYDVHSLPAAGTATRTPWPGDYWATARDSINYRWDADQPSPAEKAEQAFSLPGFAAAVSHREGIYSQQSRPPCDALGECVSLQDGSVCAIPRAAAGATSGRCIPNWWGINHGWAAAAVSEPAPIQPVIRNGVTFYPGDIEALASLIHARGSSTSIVGQRCNLVTPGLDDGGQVIEGECRDANPGAFHVIITNMLGLRRAAIIVDRVAATEVWNHPVRGYRVTNSQAGRLKEISSAQALALLGLDVSSFTTLLSGVSISRDEQRRGWHQATAGGEIVLRMQGTGDADLYVTKGDTATAVVYDCHPYSAGSNEECRVPVQAGDVVSWMIRGYSETSYVSLFVGAAVSSTADSVYSQNMGAVQLFHVEMDVDYISESDPARESRVAEADVYTRTDRYSYVLEVNSVGKIIGGEWLGRSREAHPDFMWWPTGGPPDLVGGAVTGGLTVAMVKDLLEEARASSGSPDTRVLLQEVDYQGGLRSAILGVPPGRKKVTLTMSGTGDADLQVGFGRQPLAYSLVARSRSVASGWTASFIAPMSGGTYRVEVRPRSTGTRIKVIAIIE